MKERYLSKTCNVTFVYLSKCNIKQPGIFGNSKKKVFVNRSSGHGGQGGHEVVGGHGFGHGR